MDSLFNKREWTVLVQFSVIGAFVRVQGGQAVIAVLFTATLES